MPEQALRNLAIALAGQAAVERTEREPKPVTPLSCQPLRRRLLGRPMTTRHNRSAAPARAAKSASSGMTMAAGVAAFAPSMSTADK